MGRYHNGSDFQLSVRITDAVKMLIIANVAVFLLQIVFGPGLLIRLLGLNSQAVLHGMIWQPVTYMFLHLDLIHLFFNMLILWMLGSEIEYSWGARSFLIFYFVTGIGAGLVCFFTGLGSPAITLGASGTIFGVLVAFAVMFPNRILLAFLIIPMRARTLVIILMIMELWMTVSAMDPNAGGVARLAHLSGGLIGYLYLKFGDRVKFSLPRIRFNTRSQKSSDSQKWADFMKNEVDPVLDKMSREGIHSLTRKERSILKKARGRKKSG